MSIVIKNLGFVYSPKTVFQKVALEDICLTIDDGDFFGIIGHTGSGKSTLIKHLNALIPVQSGQIFVNDIALHQRFDYKKLRAKVGMVFQYPEYQLFEETVYKDIAFGPKNLGLDKQEIHARVMHAMQAVGLDFETLKERSPFEISGGQKRRVALAGVLAMKPDILILDEPTAGLDPRGKQEVLKLLQELKQEISIIIMISHNMDEIAQVCNKVAVLDGGKLHSLDAPTNLFSHTQMLQNLGLDVPTACEFARVLREHGIDLPQDIITLEQLKTALLQRFGGNL